MERLGVIEEIKYINGKGYQTKKRRAKVGEKILIVDAASSHLYENGDVLTITNPYRWGDDDNGGVSVAELDVGIFHDEYVVLEPYSGPVVNTEPVTTDMVEHPSHYTSGKFEVIEIINEVTKGYDDSFVGYCIGNTQKYIARAPHKGKLVEDLRKATKYLEFAIEHLEGDSE